LIEFAQRQASLIEARYDCKLDRTDPGRTGERARTQRAVVSDQMRRLIESQHDVDLVRDGFAVLVSFRKTKCSYSPGPLATTPVSGPELDTFLGRLKERDFGLKASVREADIHLPPGRGCHGGFLLLSQ